MPNLLWFEWERDVDGYRIEKLKPGEAPEYESEAERKLGCLVPIGRAALRYRPLDECPGMFMEFARCKQTPDEAADSIALLLQTWEFIQFREIFLRNPVVAWRLPAHVKANLSSGTPVDNYVGAERACYLFGNLASEGVVSLQHVNIGLRLIAVRVYRTHTIGNGQSVLGAQSVNKECSCAVQGWTALPSGLHTLARYFSAFCTKATIAVSVKTRRVIILQPF